MVKIFYQFQMAVLWLAVYWRMTKPQRMVQLQQVNLNRISPILNCQDHEQAGFSEIGMLIIYFI